MSRRGYSSDKGWAPGVLTMIKLSLANLLHSVVRATATLGDENVVGRP